MVQPGDDLFWFDNPSIMLFLIHLVLFTVLMLGVFKAPKTNVVV